MTRRIQNSNRFADQRTFQKLLQAALNILKRKLKREMATMMRTIANEVWRSKASRFFGMAEARIDKEIERVRGKLCLGEISGEEFGDSDNGG